MHRNVFLISCEQRRGGKGIFQLALEVTCRVDGDHSCGPGSLSDVDLLDQSVRERAAHENRMHRARTHKVVREMAMPRDKTGVFAAMNLGSDELADRHVSCLRPRRWLSWPGRRSSSWPRSAR